jgi:hypothetical protein
MIYHWAEDWSRWYIILHWPDSHLVSMIAKLDMRSAQEDQVI